ncbi:MAG: endopeptidase La [Candidatus Tectomicrobia bacterium]|uniref:Lon protease n=1 Tax=Tectimicrobiota bacterium TaxID=2528274 RepID=A0A932MNE3_UNCTE|nr:endopeptidase La [Candidatus Tectomicrobia bacterium]
MVLFPRMISPVFISRGRALATVEAIPPDVRRVVAVLQRDLREEEPEPPKGFHRIGVIAEIVQSLRLSDGTVKVLLEGAERCRIEGFRAEGEAMWAAASPVREPAGDPVELGARCRTLLARFEDYLRVNHRIPHEAYASVEALEGPAAIADGIAANVPFKLADKQRLLEEADPAARIAALAGLLEGEIELLKVERRLRSRVQRQMDRSQKEFFLTEQLKAIQRELGQSEGLFAEGEELRRKAKEVELPPEVAEKVEKEIKRLEMMTPLSAEASVVRSYVEWLLDVPWTRETRDHDDLIAARAVLDQDHYGLKKVKERILEHIAVKILNQAIRGPILCFVGPPGVGKTSLGRSIASALGRKFVRVSLGGVRDEAEIRGHRRTYIGSLPGRVIQSMKRAGTVNPVFMLDEVDKMSADFRGDPSSALLEALDPEQNKSFSDHYLEVDYDLSRVFFITTANTTDPIPSPLLDRMEVIHLPGYTDEEKMEIARRFLAPRQLAENGLRPGQLDLLPETLARLIHEYTREAGVRGLEREIGTLCRKVARNRVERRASAPKAPKGKGKGKAREAPIRLAPGDLEAHLGAPRYFPERPETRAGVGVATGLAWTPSGGLLLPVEVSVMDGKGHLILTGKLGDVMKESAQAALSWLRARARELGIPADFHEKRDIHIHLPEGAVPKDGPSAGITMALAMASALTGRKVRHDAAMSGEVTLRGRVLCVGAVKEKLLAARRGGIPRVVLPRENEKDVREIEADSPLGLEITFVESMDEVVRACLLPLRQKKGAEAPLKAGRLPAGAGRAHPAAPARRKGGGRRPAQPAR